LVIHRQKTPRRQISWALHLHSGLGLQLTTALFLAFAGGTLLRRSRLFSGPARLVGNLGRRVGNTHRVHCKKQANQWSESKASHEKAIRLTTKSNALIIIINICS